MDWNKILNSDRFRKSERDIKYDRRNEFESDYGRIIFSPAVRRMHDKTQVIPLTRDDNIHTRLTHSMEVQSIAYSFGIRLCSDEQFIEHIKVKYEEALRIIPPILSSISLCHDIGNPPFGHFGEKVISNFFANYFENNNNISLNKAQKLDFTKYNGNAQGFRILSKQQVLQDDRGLNLTFGVLAASLKYPFLSDELTNIGFGDKIGIFQSEKTHLQNLRNLTGLDKVRHPLTFLMEASDNICYNVMDLEDGYNSGYFSYNELIDLLKRSKEDEVTELIEKFETKKGSEIDDKKINAERTKIVQFRIFLISELVKETISRFLKKLPEIEKGNYHDELLSEKNSSLIKVLRELNDTLIFQKREVQSLELTGESVIKGLLNHFVSDFINYKERKSPSSKRAEKLFGQISSSLKILMEIECNATKLYELDDYYKLRLIVDYISGMTDNFALSLYQKLQGIKI